MSNIPKNTKLWELCVTQAKAKFSKWPSAAASAWVHRTYVEKGGQFVGSTTELNPDEKRDYDADQVQKERDRGPHDTKAPGTTY